MEYLKISHRIRAQRPKEIFSLNKPQQLWESAGTRAFCLGCAVSAFWSIFNGFLRNSLACGTVQPFQEVFLLVEFDSSILIVYCLALISRNSCIPSISWYSSLAFPPVVQIWWLLAPKKINTAVIKNSEVSTCRVQKLSGHVMVAMSSFICSNHPLSNSVSIFIFSCCLSVSYVAFLTRHWIH